ncbi:MAG: NAD(P)-dependent methylenetetrahydromethanopterin dehydrogenase [Eubacteriales bacterium]
MKKILIHLESDPKASVFDQIAAYDAGVDQIIPYGGVQPGLELSGLVYGGMFTRGGDELKNTAIFIGGTDFAKAQVLMKKVQKLFFGPVRLSVMLDANGSNTTAAALVHKIVHGRDVKGKKVLVMGGTGPVGIRAAILLAKEGCEVYLSSRERPDEIPAEIWKTVQQICNEIEETYGVKINPAEISNNEDAKRVLAQGMNIVACCGAPGSQILDKEVWMNAPSLEIITDINAVNPLGVEGIKVSDNAKEREGKILYGAIAIGNFKMKIHRAAIQSLFKDNNQILDFDSMYEIAKQMEE